MARKRFWSFCQKCRWQITPTRAYTRDPSKSEWADYAAVQAECGNLWENKLTSNSSGNTRLQSSQLAEPLWTIPGIKRGLSVHTLISTLKKKKKKKKDAGGEWIVEHSPNNTRTRGKATTITESRQSWRNGWCEINFSKYGPDAIIRLSNVWLETR